ncbi:MAG: RNase H family protein [Myxococcota bacterium]
MGWRKATFKDQTVWVEVDGAGEPKVEGGRVPIRYQARPSAKVYRAGVGRVTVEPGAPIEELAEGESADAGGKSPRSGASGGKAGRGSGFGKAGTRTAAQAAMAADAARAQIESLRGEAIIAFSDGACRGNPGVAGSGAMIELPDGRRFEGSKHLGRATNNIAELTAVDLVLDLLEDAGVDASKRVAIFSDSSYTNGVLVKNWKAKANQELIANLRLRLKDWPNVEIVWIAGHAGIDGNERADTLANRGADGVSERRSV